MAESKALVEKRNELEAKRKKLFDVFEQAKTEDPAVLDLKKVTLIEGDEAHKRTEIKRMNDEMSALGMQVELLVEQGKVAEMGEQLSRAQAMVPFSGSGGAHKNAGKSIGELFIESAAYKDRTRAGGPAAEIDMDIKSLISSLEGKTVMSTSAGWAPQAIRTGTVVPMALRPVQVLDLIPQGETTQASVVYMEETTATNAAAELNEAAAYAESAFALTERTSNVRKVATILPVTDEQLDDIPQVQGYVNNRLVFFLRQRLDLQVLNGDGVAPNLKGIINTSGIQTQAKGADPAPDAIYKAMVKVRITGRAFPSGIVQHPTDWQNIRLLRTAEGVYIWGSPSEAGPERIWGLPVAQADSLSQGTSLVGDYANFCELDFRKGIEVQIGYVNDDFSKGKKSLRADLRAAFVVYRPAAFCTVTGL